ncbi:MAG: hypothetical protein V3S72_01785 [Desulfobacterales bacterium]
MFVGESTFASKFVPSKVLSLPIEAMPFYQQGMNTTKQVVIYIPEGISRVIPNVA